MPVKSHGFSLVGRKTTLQLNLAVLHLTGLRSLHLHLPLSAVNDGDTGPPDQRSVSSFRPSHRLLAVIHGYHILTQEQSDCHSYIDARSFNIRYLESARPIPANSVRGKI